MEKSVEKVCDMIFEKSLNSPGSIEFDKIGNRLF